MNKMKFLKYSIFGLCLAAMLALGGCKSSQGSAGQPEVPAAGAFSLNGAWQGLAGSYGQWSDVEMPVKLFLEKPSQVSISGKAVMVNGQAVSLSLRKIGFEVANIYLDGTSAVLVSKPLRIAWSEDLGALAAAAGISVADVQSMLLGRIFDPGAGTVSDDSRDRFKLAMQGAGTGGRIFWNACLKHSRKPICFDVETVDTVSTLVDLSAEIGAGVDVVYGAPVQTECGTVAASVTASTTYQAKELQGGVQWTPSKAKWNAGVSLSTPTVPEGYRRLTTAELLDIIKNL